jgi:hypothetical protein
MATDTGFMTAEDWDEEDWYNEMIGYPDDEPPEQVED